MNAIQMLAPPFYSEARAHCDRFEITDSEACERVRLSMVHREYMRRMEPFTRMLVDVSMFDLPGRPKSPEYLLLEHEVSEIAARFRKELGIGPVGADRQEGQTGLASRP